MVSPARDARFGAEAQDRFQMSRKKVDPGRAAGGVARKVPIARDIPRRIGQLAERAHRERYAAARQSTRSIAPVMFSDSFNPGACCSSGTTHSSGALAHRSI